MEKRPGFPPGQHPLELAAARALQKAEAAGGHTIAHWIRGGDCWFVASASTPGQHYTVTRKYPDGPGRDQTPAQAATNRHWWWFTLHCDCPAGEPTDGSRPKAVCWHKAAVRCWQLFWGRRDGNAWGTIPEWSPASVRLNTGDPDQRLDRLHGFFDPDTSDVLTEGDEPADCDCFPGPINCPVLACGCYWCQHHQMGAVTERRQTPEDDAAAEGRGYDEARRHDLAPETVRFVPTGCGWCGRLLGDVCPDDCPGDS